MINLYFCQIFAFNSGNFILASGEMMFVILVSWSVNSDGSCSLFVLLVSRFLLLLVSVHQVSLENLSLFITCLSKACPTDFHVNTGLEQ